MKYYVIEISTGDSKISGKAIYEYNSEREAVADFHKKLGIAMASDLYATELIIVIDGESNYIKSEYYVAPVIDTE